LALADHEAIQNDTIGYAHVENFALKIFLNADNEDRNGAATKFNTF
jgi:vacuolar protein sorting-associated protein VTA1